MEDFWISKLETMLEDFNYNTIYDFDDMKLAIMCEDFIVGAIDLDHIDYEQIITLANWVRLQWNAEYEDLGREEQGYIQAYARRILNENINEIEKILRRISNENINEIKKILRGE